MAVGPPLLNFTPALPSTSSSERGRTRGHDHYLLGKNERDACVRRELEEGGSEAAIEHLSKIAALMCQATRWGKVGAGEINLPSPRGKSQLRRRAFPHQRPLSLDSLGEAVEHARVEGRFSGLGNGHLLDPALHLGATVGSDFGGACNDARRGTLEEYCHITCPLPTNFVYLWLSAPPPSLSRLRLPATYHVEGGADDIGDHGGHECANKHGPERALLVWREKAGR